MFELLYFGGYGFYGFDPLYFILVLPAILLAMWAQFNVQSTFNRYSQRRAARGYTGAEVARMILDRNGLYQVAVERAPGGKLSDHYDPRKRVVRLSAEVHDGTSVAALGVAAHETGHAVQHASHYAPLSLRNAIIPVTQIGSVLAMPLVILGLIINLSQLIFAGIILFGLATLFQLITLPVEFNASKRAVKTLEDMYIVSGEELAGTKRVLRAAALTYVAALAVSLAQLLRLLLLFSGRRDD